MGEETDNVVESTSKLQEKLKALTGVDILTDAGAYKDTYTILKEIGAVWQDLEELDRAAALELMAGKNRANTLSAILNNVKDLEDAYNDAIDAEGSAQRELDTYLNSIKGRIDLFNNSVQTMWMNTINSEAVKNIVNLGTGLVNIIDKLGLIKTLVVGIATYFMTFSKHKIDLASILGIHNLDDEFLKGFSVIGKQGLTGKIAQAFKPKEKNKIISEVLGDSRDIKLSVEDFASAIKDNINDYVTIDTSEIDSAIDSVQQKLIIARKQLNEIEDPKKVKSSRGNDWNFYKVFGSSSPAKDRDNYVAEKIQEIKTLENQLAELQQKRDDIVSSAVNNVATSMVTSIDNEKQAYQSMLSVLSEVQETKLYLGNEQDAAIKIDAISQAAKNGQIDLANYVSSLNDTDIALKAYVASVQDGNYSLAGFQQFITQHNASVQASGIAAKAAAIGHQLLNSALTMGIGLLVSFAIEGIVKALDAMIVTTEELTEQVRELEDTYKNAKETFKENLIELTTSSDTELYATLEDEFKRLTRGVDEYGNNISLTSDQYERYKEICEKIVGINPQIAAGYDSATQAIGNNASALSQLIELQRIQARENAKQYLQSENLDKLATNAYNNLDTARNTKGIIENEGLNYWDQSSKFATQLKDSITSTLASGQSWDVSTYDLFALFGLSDKYDASNTVYDEKYFVDEYYEVILSKLAEAVNNNKGLHYELASGQTLDIDADAAKLLYNQLQGFVIDYQNKVDDAEKDIQAARNGLINILLQVPFSQDAYDKLSDKSKNILTEWIKNSEIFKIDPNATETEIQDQLDKNVDLIEKMTTLFANKSTQAVVNGLDDIDTSSVTAREYEDAIWSAASKIWDQIGGESNEYGFKSIFDIQSLLGVDHQSEMQKLWDGAEIIGGYLEKARGDIINEFNYQTMTRDEMKAFLGIDWNAIGTENVNSIQDVWDIIHNAMNISNITPVKTYAALTTELESYNEALKQTSEIILDNTEVTQEYKDSLKALGISEKELAEYFDEANPLIVKNAKGLNDLVKASKNNIARNAQLAKSQARLQYYELYKEMSKLVAANGKVLEGNEDLILSYYDEMKAIEQTIAKYSRLEAQLLGNVTAYEEFQKAQESDAETDPVSGIEEMAVALGEAFNTAELGTETAKSAIAGLVPESIYESLDTVDEKMAAIYDYFKNGKLAQYFDLSFDDDGNIESAEMKLGNLRKFIEDGFVNGALAGSDWQHFEFSDDFLAGLETADDKLQYFADKFEVTKDVAFAVIEAINDHDAEWLNGDYGSMFDALLPESAQLEDNIHKNTAALAELNAQVAGDKISAEEYTEKYDALTQTQNELGQQARENINQYQDLTEQIDEQKKKVDEYTAAIQKMRDQGKSEDEIKTSVEYGSLIKASGVYTELIQKRSLLSEPTEILVQFAIDNIDKEISNIENELENKIKFGEDGIYTVKVGVDLSQEDIDKLQQYKKLWEEKHNIEVETDPEETKTALEEIESSAQSALDVIDLIDGTTITINTSTAVSNVDKLRSALEKLAGVETASVTITPPSVTSGNYSRGDRGYAMANGTAHASGDWGLSTNEHNSLVGELGRELIVDPHSGRYYTVGDNGAEFVDLKKDSIIFNHKQTEELLKNGHINSRGKAYAEGNAHVTLWSNGSSTSQWEGTGYDGPNDESYDLSEALKDAADSADDFADTLDWIAIRMEEYEEAISKLNAQLENAVGAYNQNILIDTIIGQLQAQQGDYQTVFNQGIYAQQAESYLAGLSDDLQRFARNGALDISLLPEDITESQMEAIQKYREFATLHAEAGTKAIEIETEIANLAKQKFDNVATQYENEISLIENVNEQLDAQVSLMEDRGYVAATAYYEAMKKQTETRQAQLRAEKDELQKVLDAEVAAGHIQVYDDNWYEMVNAIYDVDAAIVECTADLESFQNAINDIYWENFDELINRLDYLKNETQNLIDLMDKDDMVMTPETEDGWGADQVEWTKEGLASLGLYAQQMEIAEYQARQYAEAIKDLTADYQAGKYSESEYLAKLNELKDAQYDSIEAYYDAQDAIKDLNSTRIDAIKDGIEKEIKAYEKLIQKEKELLDAEKDAHDWEKSIQESEKDISTIKRKLMAIEGDTSIAATAKRKQLEAELAEAQYELEEKYLDRSYENKQNALDKELENFQEEKDAEVEKWEKYLEDIEIIISDSLNIVQANASGIYDTLGAKAEEYNLTVSDAVMSPWRDGALAVSDYQTAFDTAMSSTMDQLAALKQAWQDVIDKMEEAARDKMAEQKESNDDITDTPAPQTYTPTTTTTITPTAPPDYTVKDGDNLWNIAGAIYKDPTRWPEIYNLNRAIIGDDPNIIHAGQIFKMPAYAKGTVSLNKSGVVNIDELGDELVLRAVNGRLSYMEKGSGIIPADLTSNLMEWGALDPTEMLNQNRPVIGVHPEIHNTEVNISMDIAEVVHIDKVDNDTLPDLTKAVEKQLDKYMKNINNNIRKYTR